MVQARIALKRLDKGSSRLTILVVSTFVLSSFAMSMTMPLDKIESASLASSPWPMFRHDLNHTGRSPYDTSGNNGQLLWKFQTDDYIGFSSPAIASDGSIYIGSQDGNLYALFANGTFKWKYATGKNSWKAVYSPAIDADGTIHFGSTDENVYALHPNGTVKWTFPAQNIVASSPAVSLEGTIYIGSHDHNLYAINTNGSERWVFEAAGSILSSPAVALDGTIYVGSHPYDPNDGGLYAIYSNGSLKWFYPVGGLYPGDEYIVWSSPSIGTDGTVYVGTYSHGRGYLYAFFPNGTLRWKFLLPGRGTHSSPAIGLDGTVYIGASDYYYNFFAINPNGTQKWNFSTKSSVHSSPAISSDGTIFFGSHDKNVYALHPNGSLKWKYATGGMIESSPSIGPDGTIYIGCSDGALYAIGQGEEGPVADAGPDQTVYEGDVVQFNGTGSYDPDSRGRAWVNKSSIATPRLAVAGAVLNDELYVIGGGEWHGYYGLESAVEKYDPKTDSWINETPIFEPHSYMGVGVVNGKLYAMGGAARNQSQSTNLEFDPDTHVWVNKTPMPSPRHNFAVAVVNDKIYAIGGKKHAFMTVLSRVEEYDPATDSWTRRADMPIGRAGLAAAVYDSKIYAIGGHNYSDYVDRNATLVEVYDPATDTWTSASPLLTGRSDLTAETLGGKIYAIGGWEPGPVIPEAAPASNVTEVYDPATDTWASAEAMWETRAKFVSGVIDGRIYVVAGHSAGMWAPFPDWSEEYGPTGELQYAWDFDVNVDSDGDGNYTNDADATGPTPTHVYYDDGIYVVTLKVTDASGLSDWDICNITVLNVPPTPEWTSRSLDGTILNPPYPEGKEILFEATVYDPGIYDTFTYDWDFGDGTILLDAGQSVTHTYGDDDVYIVVLTVTDDDGGVGIDDTPPLDTTNENPIPSISLPFCIFTEGTSPCEAIGEFTDPGWLDTHSAVWDYGDGTYETAVLTGENDPPDATGMNITSHIYGDNGVYNITFTVVDDDGGVGTAWAEAQVMNLPPSVDMTAPSTVNEGEDFVLAITATDPGSDDLAVHVDWGDGTSETETHYNNGIGPDPPNSGEGVYPFTVYSNLTHVYGDNGNFTIQVTAEDDDGGSVQDSAAIEVLNLPPEIVLLAVPLSVNEGEEFSVVAEATDQGSDDIEFSWTFELGPSMSTMYYNDGVDPDPLPSPWGTFPFTAEDTVNHTYGDNGYYNVTITATDDDGGVSTSIFTIEIRNVEPSIDIGGPYAGDENSPIEFTATVTDPGSDDLTLLWDWGDGTTDAIAFYNDGISVDPSKSPWGTYPFDATHTLSHLWGDNGDFTVTLTVMDDDGGVTVEQTVVTVNNIAPTIESIAYYLNASFAFRIAGEKWHNVEIFLYEDGTEIGYANITRYPGSPNEQMATLADISIDFSKTYSAIAYYTPEDDPINGQIWGATPAWVILDYEDGEERIHHTFNVRHEDTWTWEIDDFSPYFLGHNITFTATASDPGSDDLTFSWDWGDGNITENAYYNDGVGPDPYPSPEVNPITVTDTVRHGYSSAGTYVIILTVTDDDGGIISYSLNLTL